MCSRSCQTAPIAFRVPAAASLASKKAGALPHACMKPLPQTAADRRVRWYLSSTCPGRLSVITRKHWGCISHWLLRSTPAPARALADIPSSPCSLARRSPEHSLAFGLQAAAILALDDPGIEVHVMSQASVARVTRRSEAEVAALAKIVPSTARDIRSFAGLGAVDRLLQVTNADEPAAGGVDSVRAALLERIRELRAHPRQDLRQRLQSADAIQNRALSIRVRQQLEVQWDATA